MRCPVWQRYFQMHFLAERSVFLIPWNNGFERDTWSQDLSNGTEVAPQLANLFFRLHIRGIRQSPYPTWWREESGTCTVSYVPHQCSTRNGFFEAWFDSTSWKSLRESHHGHSKRKLVHKRLAKANDCRNGFMTKIEEKWKVTRYSKKNNQPFNYFVPQWDIRGYVSRFFGHPQVS